MSGERLLNPPDNERILRIKFILAEWHTSAQKPEHSTSEVKHLVKLARTRQKLIAADEVTNDVTDYRQLAGLALEAKGNLKLKATEVMADKGFYNAVEVSRCVEASIPPYVPKADTSANTQQGLLSQQKYVPRSTKFE